MGESLAGTMSVYVSSRVAGQRLAALAEKARGQISGARRILVQMDEPVTTRSSGMGMALARTANIVEQTSHLHASGRGSPSWLEAQPRWGDNCSRARPSPDTLESSRSHPARSTW